MGDNIRPELSGKSSASFGAWGADSRQEDEAVTSPPMAVQPFSPIAEEGGLPAEAESGDGPSHRECPPVPETTLIAFRNSAVVQVVHANTQGCPDSIIGRNDASCLWLHLQLDGTPPVTRASLIHSDC